MKTIKEEKTTRVQKHIKRKKKVSSPDFVTKIAAEIEGDRRTTIRKLATSHGVSIWTILSTLLEDLDPT
jgi:hypothetical protein